MESGRAEYGPQRPRMQSTALAHHGCGPLSSVWDEGCSGGGWRGTGRGRSLGSAFSDGGGPGPELRTPARSQWGPPSADSWPAWCHRIPLKPWARRGCCCHHRSLQPPAPLSTYHFPWEEIPPNKSSHTQNPAAVPCHRGPGQGQRPSQTQQPFGTWNSRPGISGERPLPGV